MPPCVSSGHHPPRHQALRLPLALLGWARPTARPLPPARPIADRAMVQSFTAAHLRFGAAMYDNQARLNQVIGYLFELQVRKSNASAERHHQRSGRFFYGMLAAQMGVVISTFAIAARQKNLLWSLAATAGLLAVSFSAWVFLRM